MERRTASSSAVADRDDPVGLVTEALIDANDQLLAMYDLAAMTSQSLDESVAVSEIIERAKRVVMTDELFFVVDGWAVGSDESYAADDGATFDVSNAAGRSGILVARRPSRPFGTPERKLLRAIANLCLGAVHAARLHAEGVSDAVMQRDHDTASAIAVMSLPQWRPAIDGVSCFARSEPARSAGGDLFAFGVRDQVVSFVVGDVAGKGLPAAMMMTTVISAATAAFQLHGSAGPAAVLESIDEWVYDRLSDASLFVTLVAGDYDVEQGRIRLVNAGHSPVLFVRGDEVTQVDADLPPIGVFPVSDVAIGLEVQAFDVHPGDRLVVASDGFTEQCNPAGVPFGDPALERAMTTSGSIDEIGEGLFHTIDAFAGRAEQSDDRTLFILGADPSHGGLS